MRTEVLTRSSLIRLVACLLSIATCSVATVHAQDQYGRFFDQVFRDESREQKYVVFVPHGYRPDKPSPAILFLHGAGERGLDNRMQLTIGLAPFVQARSKTFPGLVIFPQCDTSEGRILETWNSDSPGGKRAIAALNDARKHYNFDEHRVVLTGWSMGGYGVWDLAVADPGRWSALLPLSGGGEVSGLASLKGIPVWAFHGAKDALIKPDEDQRLVQALKDAGGTATYTELADVGHDITEEVYGNDAVIAWMLNPKTAATQLGARTVKPMAAVNLPFVPKFEISQAIGIRLGNEVLDAFAHSIPQTVSQDMLTGRLNDMFDSTVAQGRQFNIRFSGISYHGQLERVVARGWERGSILVQLGIRNVRLTIGGTSVTGARHSAQAGPISISIGHRYPIWFNLELAPYVADRKLKLRLVSSGCQISNDNYSVSQPAGISVQGFGMTEEAVSSGLTSGLYGARGRIEREVTSIAPRIAAEIERNLTLPESSTDVSQPGSSLSKVWPLPLNPPRFHVWPEQVTADKEGVTLIAGMTVADIDPLARAKPLEKLGGVASGKGDATGDLNVSFAQVPSDTSLHLVVTPRILTPVVEMYTTEDRTKMDLLDIPEPLFAKLADRTTLQEIIPDLKRYGEKLEVRSTLRISKPLEVKDPEVTTASSSDKPIELSLPDVQVRVSIKPEGETAWKSCATFDLSLAERMRPELLKPYHDQRLIGLEWLPSSKLTGTGQFAEGYTAKDSKLDVDQYVSRFKEAWEAYIASLKSTTAEAPDLPIGNSKMRMYDLKYSSKTLDITYKLARIKLTNLTDQPFTYQTKAPTSSWGEPLTLKPNASHEFEIPYSLTYRRTLPTGTEVYTLPVGSHSEFRVPVTGGAPRLFSAKRS